MRPFSGRLLLLPIDWRRLTRRPSAHGGSRSRHRVSSAQRCRLLMALCLLAVVPLPMIYVAVNHRRAFSALNPFKELKLDEGQRSTAQPYKGYDTCGNLRRPTDAEVRYRSGGHWQVHEEGKEEILVYSAFYDDRPSAGPRPSIRILGLRRLSRVPLYCYVWYNATEETQRAVVVVEAEIVKTGADQTVKGGGGVYSQLLFSCALPPQPPPPPQPAYVSLAVRRCAPSSIRLPVFRSPPADGTWTHDFGVCLEVNFGYFPPQLIVEWMELHSLLGVTLVNLYNGSIDGRLDRVVDHYVRKGLVDLRQMPPPLRDHSMADVRLSSPASLNDCMMRNMYTHRLIVVVDFDEVIVPRMDGSYTDMIRRIDQSLNLTRSHHTYSFRNAYFFAHFPEDTSQPAHLKTLRLRFRAPPSDYLFGGKSMMDPRRCKSVFNHYCWIRFDGAADKGFGLDVDAAVALSHHYRTQCPFDASQCAAYDRDKTLDDAMLRFKTQLVDRVSEVSKEIGLIV